MLIDYIRVYQDPNNHNVSFAQCFQAFSRYTHIQVSPLGRVQPRRIPNGRLHQSVSRNSNMSARLMSELIFLPCSARYSEGPYPGSLIHKVIDDP